MDSKITKQDILDLRIDPTKPVRAELIIDGYYTRPEWKTDKYIYSISQNGLGHFWPQMHTIKNGERYYPIIICDSNPFKKIGSAISFIEKHIAWKQKGALNKTEL